MFYYICTIEKETAFITNTSSSISQNPCSSDNFSNTSESNALLHRDNSSESAGAGCGFSS